ncbi:MAG: glycosyltransferase family 39 protein [Patescibacteria group bacterium]
MNLIQKALLKYKLEILIVFGLGILYFLLRLYNIMSLPIFTDEAIYVRWSQIARQDAAWRFISLTDGKQPMFVWIAMNIMRIVDDPLLASRLVSVFAGFFTMIGLFFLANELFKNIRIGLISAFLYVIYPFALVYDRMALYDSLVGMFIIWGLYFEVLLIRRLRLDIALILGMIIGGGILTKTSGFFSIYLLPSTLLLFGFERKNVISKLLKWIILSLITVSVAYGFYFILRLSPFFYIIGEKNALFVYPISEWMMHPFTYLQSNLSGLWNWFITYFTWPVFLLTILSFFINFKFLREKLLLVIWFLIPFVALIFFGKTIYPRFIFFMTLPLLPLVGFSIFSMFERLKNKYLSLLIIGVFLIFFFKADYFVLTDFKNAPIAGPDLGQYINDWPAGGGIKEIVSYLDHESKKQKIFVVSPGTFGSLPTYSVEIYLGTNKNIDKQGIFPVPSEIPKEFIEKSKKMPVYVFVSSQKEFEDLIKLWPVEEVLRVSKGRESSYSILYIVKSS